MVSTSGFTHVPCSRFLILGSILSSICVSILDIKHLAPLKFTPHLWPYLQFDRIVTFQFAYTSATELLISTILLYQFRVLERIWGTRKYASFILASFGLNMVLVPVVGSVMKILTLGGYNYIPSGMVGVVFAALSVWGEEIPRMYSYKIITGAEGAGDQDSAGVVLSDKSTTYFMAAQLALSQFPYQILPALIGWVVGSAWTGGLLPGGLDRRRVPSWVVGETKASKERGQFEGLRRRLEEEGSAADGMRNVSDQQENRPEDRRGFLAQVGGYFTGS